MKRRLMLAAMSLILTVTLSVTSMNTVAEASPKMSPTEENLEITINSFLESDGAVAEELTDEMLKTFLETPLDFLRVIDTYPLDKQELLLSRIANVAVGMPDEERLSFEDIIYSADETTPGTINLSFFFLTWHHFLRFCSHALCGSKTAEFTVLEMQILRVLQRCGFFRTFKRLRIRGS